MKRIKRTLYKDRYSNPLWRPWLRLRQQKMNRNHPAYDPDMEVLELDNFEAFATWVETDIGYKPGSEYKFSRRDFNKGWIPGNVCYASAKEVTTRACGRYFIRYRNKYTPITEISEMTGIKYATLVARVRAGWQEKDIVRAR